MSYDYVTNRDSRCYSPLITLMDHAELLWICYKKPGWFSKAVSLRGLHKCPLPAELAGHS